MRRRDVIATLGGAAAGWPNRAQSQIATVPIVGCLAAAAESTYGRHVAAVRQGLRESGFVDGQNVALEFRWADGNYDRLPALAEDLVSRRVNVIMTMGGGPPLEAARRATSKIPIVFHYGADPVRLGFVASLARPGGNITGVTLMTSSLEPKRLGLLRETVPGTRTIGVLVNPSNPQNGVQMRQLQELAPDAKLTLVSVNASTPQQLEDGFVGMLDQKIDALTVLSDVFFTSNSARIATLSERSRIPTIAHSREFADAGGLMSYGANLSDAYRLAATYAGRILKGESPAELPVIEPSRFDFVINLRAAKKLDLAVPSLILAAADDVLD